MTLTLLSALIPRQHPHFFVKVALHQIPNSQNYVLLHATRPYKFPTFGLLKITNVYTNSLHISKLTSLVPEEYKGVGRALHEGAYRLSLKHGFEGRVTLQSTKESVLFHQKCGFELCPFQDDINNLMSLSEKMQRMWQTTITLSEPGHLQNSPK